MFDLKKIRTRVAGVVFSNDRLLLVSHKKDGKVYWLLPGGGVQYGETLEESLKREFYEELNVEVEVKRLAFICDSIEPSGKRHIINIHFFCDICGGELKLGRDDRLNGFRFYAIDEIPGLLIYPPVNSELVSIMNSENSKLYLGRIWKEE